MNSFKIMTASVLILISTASFAALPVLPGKDQQKMLQSSDAQLAENKQFAYDFFRIVLRGLRLEQASDFMHENYMQHNPNAETGLSGFVDYFTNVLGDNSPPEIPDELPGLVSIQAEGDYVTLSFVRECSAGSDSYSTTWFDMFRIVDGKIVEHWDSALLGAGSNC